MPVLVKPDIEEINTLVPTPGLRVTVGPRRFLEELGQRIEEKNPAIEVVDPLAFRDAAFPEGGWYLDELLASRRGPAIAAKLGVRYLALVRNHGYTSKEWDDFRAPPVMGVVAYADRQVIAAIVVDLQENEPVAYLTIDAEGRGAGGWFLIYGLFTIPMTEEGAEGGVAKSIAEVALRNGTGGPVRVAVLAAEAEIERFCLVVDVENCDQLAAPD